MPKRYILALIGIAVVFFGGIALIISLLSGSDAPKPAGTNTNSSSQTATQKVRDLSNDASVVQFTTYGSVVAEEDRRAIRITVTPSERKLEILRGYSEEVMQNQSTGNNPQAFNALLIALESAGFSNINREVKSDEKAFCVTGTRYAYDISYTDGEKQRSWSTSCGTREGNFTGNRVLVQNLLKDQIPNYSKLTSGVRL